MFICLFVYYSVYRLVCQQGCTNTSEQISKSLEWRLGLGPQETTFTFQLLVSYRDLAKVSTLLSATPVSSGFVTFYWVQVSSAFQQTLYRCVLGMTQIKPIRVLFLISVQSQACLCLHIAISTVPLVSSKDLFVDALNHTSLVGITPEKSQCGCFTETSQLT